MKNLRFLIILALFSSCFGNGTISSSFKPGTGTTSDNTDGDNDDLGPDTEDANDFHTLQTIFNESIPTLTGSPSFGGILAPMARQHGNMLNQSLWSYSPLSGFKSFFNLSGIDMNSSEYVKAFLDTDSNQQNGIMGRANSTFLLGCIISHLAPKTGNALTIGNQTIDIAQQFVTDEICGPASGPMNQFSGGMQFDIVVSIPDIDTHFDYKVTFNLLNEVYYFRNSKNKINALSFSHETDAAGDSFSVNTLSYDKSTQIGIFQYFDASEKDGGSSKLYRVLFNESADDVRIIKQTNYIHSMDLAGSFSIATTYHNQTELALSLGYQNVFSPYNLDVSNQNACIDSNGTIIENMTNTCPTHEKITADSSEIADLASEMKNINVDTFTTSALAEGLVDDLPTFDNSTITTATLQLD